MGKYTYIYRYIYIHSLDLLVTGLRPLTGHGTPGLPVASPTGRHTHAQTGLSSSWFSEWPRRNLTVIVQRSVEEALCPRMLAACCSLEVMVETWVFPRSWHWTQSNHCNPGQSSAVIQQQERDIASEALGEFLTTVEGSILIFNQTLGLRPV